MAQLFIYCHLVESTEISLTTRAFNELDGSRIKTLIHKPQ